MLVPDRLALVMERWRDRKEAFAEWRQSGGLAHEEEVQGKKDTDRRKEKKRKTWKEMQERNGQAQVHYL